MKSALLCPLWPLNHRMCVIAKGLGSLHTGHGNVFGVSTFSRIILEDMVHLKNGDRKNGDSFVTQTHMWLSARVLHPVGRLRI